MVAVSKWPTASWFHLWKKIVREIQLYEPMFLDVNGHLRPNPRWSLRIGLLCGILQTQFFSHVVLFVFLQVPSQYLFLSFFLFDLSLLILRSLSLLSSALVPVRVVPYIRWHTSPRSRKYSTRSYCNPTAGPARDVVSGTQTLHRSGDLSL